MIGGKPTITTKTLTLADTEYEVSIPSGVNRFEVKSRAEDALIKVAVASGGDYVTVGYGSSYAENDVKGGFTLYIQSPTAGTVVEIKYWK